MELNSIRIGTAPREITITQTKKFYRTKTGVKKSCLVPRCVIPNSMMKNANFENEETLFFSTLKINPKKYAIIITAEENDLESQGLL